MAKATINTVIATIIIATIITHKNYTSFCGAGIHLCPSEATTALVTDIIHCGLAIAR